MSIFKRIFSRNNFSDECVKPELAFFLNKGVDWLTLQLFVELQRVGLHGSQTEMPENIKSAIIQYLFGATLAIEEDLRSTAGIENWAKQLRFSSCNWVVGKEDAKRCLYELRRCSGKIDSDYIAFSVLGGGAMRATINQLSSGSDMEAWIQSHNSAFGSAVSLFLDRS